MRGKQRKGKTRSSQIQAQIHLIHRLIHVWISIYAHVAPKEEVHVVVFSLFSLIVTHISRKIRLVKLVTPAA